MYRQEEYLDFAKEYLSSNMERNKELLAKEFEKNGSQIRDVLLSCMDRLFQKCIKQQMEGIKRPIRYIHFFYLNLAVLTGNYDIQINAFSEESYMDATESMEFWKPSFMMQMYKRDMEELEKEAKKQVIRFGYSQMLEVKERSYLLYLILAGQYLAGLAEAIAEIPSFYKMEKADGIQMVFGGYMDTGIQIWPKIQPERETQGEM